MPNYKSVRLEESVWEELVKRQRPRESISQALERLLRQSMKFEEVIDRLNQILYQGEQ